MVDSIKSEGQGHKGWILVRPAEGMVGIEQLLMPVLFFSIALLFSLIYTRMRGALKT
jgi:hypothetical protein